MTERTIPKISRKAPAFSLSNQNEQPVKLQELTGQWVVVYFYPKDNTPGCTTEACEFTDSITQFENLRAMVIGISPDSAKSHQKFIAKNNLKVTLLSDVDKKVMKKYGAWGIKKMYGQEVEGVIRSTFLIDPEGNIAYAWANVKAAGHAEKVKEKLTELAK
jgi:peroxiredoxin Q/BCP